MAFTHVRMHVHTANGSTRKNASSAARNGCVLDTVLAFTDTDLDVRGGDRRVQEGFERGAQGGGRGGGQTHAHASTYTHGKREPMRVRTVNAHRSGGLRRWRRRRNGALTKKKHMHTQVHRSEALRRWRRRRNGALKQRQGQNRVRPRARAHGRKKWITCRVRWVDVLCACVRACVRVRACVACVRLRSTIRRAPSIRPHTSAGSWQLQPAPPLCSR